MLIFIFLGTVSFCSPGQVEDRRCRAVGLPASAVRKPHVHRGDLPHDAEPHAGPGAKPAWGKKRPLVGSRALALDVEFSILSSNAGLDLTKLWQVWTHFIVVSSLIFALQFIFVETFRDAAEM